MSLDKEERQNQYDRLSLLARAAAEKKVGVLLLLEGPNLPGIKRLAARMARIMDPRHFRVERIPERDSGRGTLSLLHPYWIALPRFGDVVIHEQAYYHQLASGKARRKDLERIAGDIVGFETTLAEDNYVVMKVFFDRDERDIEHDFRSLKRHVRKLIRDRLHRITSRYADYTAAMTHLIHATDRPQARWFHAPAAGTLAEMEEDVLNHFIHILELRLATDSRAAVREFEEAMSLRREKRVSSDA